MRIEDWLQDFLLAVRESFPPQDWPKVGTDAWEVFFEDFRKAFARNGVSPAEAEEARSLMAEDPPSFRRQYLPATIKAVKLNRELSPPGADRVDDRESATDASRGCTHCHGMGLALVYAARPDPDRHIPADVAAYCVCALGRWIESTHAKESPDVHRRIPDLRAVIAGRSVWRQDPPGLDLSGDRDRPAVGVSGLIRAWTAAAAEEEATRVPPPVPTPRRHPDWMGVREERTTPEPDPEAVEAREGSYGWL